MKERQLASAAIIATLLFGGTAGAVKTETLVKADNKADFPALVAALQIEMAPGGRYEFITLKERGLVNSGLADMQALLSKYGDVANMPLPERIQLFNDQDAVNKALTMRDNERLICESVAPVGSHIPRTTCSTYREVQIKKDQDRKFVDDASRLQPNGLFPSSKSLGPSTAGPSSGGGH